MGRSSTFCLKIVACGSDSVDRDDLKAQASVSKDSSAKRGWSFWWRSARHLVLRNTVISEMPSFGNKESTKSTALNFQTQANSTCPEKTSATQWTDEKPQLPASVDPKLSETVTALREDTDVTLDEAVIIVVQTAIRGFLAQRALLKHKKIVKLQAVVRGHLVRRHAVGTLRCFQAIVKMQSLVRARHARLTIEGSSTEEKLDGKPGKDNYSSKLLQKEDAATKPHVTYTSIEKLVINRFARQLLESTTKTKSINVKCDSSKSDSAWKWLERWMSVSSTRVEEPQRLEPITKQQEEEKMEHSDSRAETTIPSESHVEPIDLMSGIGEAAMPSEIEENMITYDSDNFDFQACRPTFSSVSHNLEQPWPENAEASNSRDKSLDLLPNQTNPSDLIAKMEPKSLFSKLEIESEQFNHSMIRFALDQTEIEGKTFVFGSRRSSNPAFIAAQSKFEELSSTANTTRSVSSSNQDVVNESYADTVSRFQVGGSECGTELSISSTLDSPDNSEVGAMQFEREAKAVAYGTSNLKSNLDVEAKGNSSLPSSDLSGSFSPLTEKHEDVNRATGEPDHALIVVDSSQVEQKPEKKASDLQFKLESEMGYQILACKSSPEASPRSRITVPESQGTPSSQVSVKPKKTKDGQSGSNKKRKSLSDGQRSSSNPNHDSGLEQLPKDHKIEKRRNSFSSARTKHVDQEPRYSCSSNSLPNYMQPTESARAKALVNSSPRSSLDVQDNDIYIKKRHSLPGANRKAGITSYPAVSVSSKGECKRKRHPPA